MWGNYILGEEGFDTDDEDEENVEIAPGNIDETREIEPDPSIYEEDQVYEMDKWPHIWPQTIPKDWN